MEQHAEYLSHPKLYIFVFQLCYLTYGTKDVLERECKNLDKKIKVIPSSYTEEHLSIKSNSVYYVCNRNPKHFSCETRM